MDTPSPSSTTRVALFENADAFARAEPTKAVVSAFGVGLIMHLLPIGAIVGGLAAVAFTLARPFLLFLGVVKACELCRHQNTKNS